MSSSAVDLENYLIPLEEIKRATENFSRQRLIGDGGFGLVYEGQLSEPWQHRTAAIKRLNRDGKQGEREFRDELKMISSFHHANIISFLGYCDQGNEMILVYEYATNGSLDRLLEDRNKMCSITWTQRLKICIDAAKGLDYLHSGLGEHNRVIHRDVKSANILLGDNLVAKICDFGLSRSGPRNQPDTQIYTKAAGTWYYMDPAYQESNILCKESDVYSFGVVLFEILSGMLSYCKRKIGDDEPQLLMTSVRRYNEKADMLIDPYIRHELDGLSFDMFKEVAYQCIHPNLMERPAMAEVIERIEEALTIQTSVQSKIRSLVCKLESVVPTDRRTSLSEICILAKINERNRLDIAEAGAIPLIINILRETLDSLTQEHAVSALYILSNTEYFKELIMMLSALPDIICVLLSGSMEAREYAAGIIAFLSECEEDRVIIVEEGAIPSLVLMFNGGANKKIKGHVAHALFLLCQNEGNIVRAVREGVVPIFLELFTEWEGDIKNTAIANLVLLSSHPEGRLAICEAKAVLVLVEHIWSGPPDDKGYATAALTKLFSGDQEDLVEAQELRESVLRKLHSIFPSDQRTALSEICLPANINNGNRLDIGEARAIPLITDLLTASDSLTQEYALTALFTLSIIEENRSSIVSSGAVVGIIHVLSKGSMEARENAAAILVLLSKIEENRVTIGAVGAITPLVLLLSEGTQRGKDYASTALIDLFAYEGNIGRAVRDGAVLILMDLLTEQQAVLMDQALPFLVLLSRHPEGRLAIGKEKVALVLFELIWTGSPDNKRYATAVLMQLFSEDQKYLMETRTLRSWILHKLRSVFPDDQGTALFGICIPAGINDRSRLDKAVAIPLITNVLTDSDSETREYALTALFMLSLFEFNRGSIVSSGAVPRIIHLLSKGSMEEQEIATAILVLLSKIEENRVTIGATGAIRPLVLLLSGGTQVLKEYIITALFDLCAYEGNIGRAVRSGVVPILMDLLTEPQVVLMDQALPFLVLLSSHREGRLAIGEADAVPILVELFRSGSPNDKENAALILNQLCSEDEKYLVEAQEHGFNTNRGNGSAGQVLEKITQVQRQIYSYWKR